MNKLSMLALAAVFLMSASHAHEPAAISQTDLVRRAQVLFDAVALGDSRPWKAYVADDAMFFDEKGRKMDKRAVLADLQPLPTGYSGSIKVIHPQSRFARDVAILSYDCDETETVFGQVLRARYHATDTWLYRAEKWQIVASQVLRYYEDPAAAKVSSTVLDDYVGTYELSPGNVTTISRRGDELFAQHGAAAAYPLLPESPDLFFRSGAEGRRLFHRDASGHVDTLIDRRNNEDILWKRIDRTG